MRRGCTAAWACQYYLPPFRAAVAAGVVTAMESYNDVNGEPVCASEKYLKRILRDDLGFAGTVEATPLHLEQLGS
jgi:beta-glucosidase